MKEGAYQKREGNESLLGMSIIITGTRGISCDLGEKEGTRRWVKKEGGETTWKVLEKGKGLSF